MKRFSGSAQRPAHHSAGSSAKRPAHHSSNVESTMATLVTHNLSRSAQQLAVLQCLEREGWLVTPLLNGCRVVVLSRAYKQALEGWPNRLECLVGICNARNLQWVAHHCPQLRFLVVDHAFPTGGNLSEALQAVARGCCQLRHLDFAGNSVSDAAIETVAQACPQLECLLMCDCHVTDGGLGAVAQHCPQLKELDVSRNSVSNAAIQAVAQACPQLRSLNVSYCCLRDEAIASVARGCPQLECLDVSGLHFLSDAAIHAVAQGCHQLKELDMTQCEMLTESAIVSIARGCTHLKWLKHSICSRPCLGASAGLWRHDLMHGLLTRNGRY